VTRCSKMEWLTIHPIPVEHNCFTLSTISSLKCSILLLHVSSTIRFLRFSYLRILSLKRLTIF
jgi:hypothetical protein